MKRGIVLSGGGARGIGHLGVLKALDEMGIQFERLVGTSAGAILGALYAYGYKPDEIFKIIIKTGFFKPVKAAFRWTGLLKLDGLGEILLRYMPENSFESLKIPSTFVVTNIKKGKAEYFSSGTLIPIVLASSCVPAIFDPIHHQGSIYVDGGLVNNFPVDVIRKECDFVVGSNCNVVEENDELKNIRSIVERSMLLAINGNTFENRKICDVLIEPSGFGKFSGFDIKKAREIFERGYLFTKDNFSPGDFCEKRA